MRHIGTFGFFVGCVFTLPFFVTWSGCMLDSSGLGVSPNAGVGGSSSSTTAPVGGGGTSDVGGAGGQPVGSGGAGGQSVGSGGAGGGGGGADCIGDEEICAPWWDTAWTRRRRILVDVANAAELVDFPVLVRLAPDRIDYAVTKPGGTDVRFLSEDGAVVLSHEMEEWAAGNNSHVWVRLPVVSPAAEGPTVLWMYYGNLGAVSPVVSEETWDSGFKSVHHFHADTNDSTSASNDGTSNNPPSAGQGMIAGARAFDGNDDHLLLPDEGDYDFTNAFSVSAWIRVQSFSKSWQAVVTKGDDSWRLHRENDSNNLGLGTTDTSDENDNFGPQTNVNDNTWHHVAGVYDGQNKKVFVDGTVVSKSYTSGLKNTNHQVCIGENIQATGRHFHGRIDEVRISSVARSDAWIIAEHRTVTVDSTLTFGVDQNVP